MSIYFLKALLIKLLDHSQANVLKGNDTSIGRSVDERMISLVFDAIDCRRVVRVGAGNNHAGQSHNVELQPRRIEPGNHFRRRDQNLLSLVTADLTTRSLVLDMNRAYLVFDKLL